MGGDGDDVLEDSSGTDRFEGGSGDDYLEDHDDLGVLIGGPGFDRPEVSDQQDASCGFYPVKWLNTQEGGFNGTQKLSNANLKISDAYSWTFEGLESGEYDVYVTWSSVSSASKTAQYAVYDNENQLPAPNPVDQTQEPMDAPVAGRPWHHLGAYDNESGTLVVTLDASDTTVIADAVRLVARSPQTIHGRVFDDENLDGGWESGEMSVKDWEIELQKIWDGDTREGTLQNTLTNLSALANYRFAGSVAAYQYGSAKYLLVGSPNTRPGVVLQYDADTGELVGLLKDPTEGNGAFGASIIVASGKILVGDPEGPAGTDVSRAGVIHIFDMATLAHLTTVSADVPMENAQFGFSTVDLENGSVLIGAPGEVSAGSIEGRLYGLDLSTNALAPFDPIPSGQTGFQLGKALAAGGGYVLAGTPDAVVDGNPVGAAHLFTTDGDYIRSFYGASGSDFGRSVALLDGVAFVGAPLDLQGTLPTGLVYAYDLDDGYAESVISNPIPTLVGDFGRALAASGDDLLVSDPFQEKVYRFAEDGGGMALEDTYSNPAPADREFGYALTDLNGMPFVGDPSTMNDDRARGAAFLFDPSAPEGIRTISNPVPALQETVGTTSLNLGTNDTLMIMTGAPDPGEINYINLLAQPPAFLALPVDIVPDPGDFFGYCLAEIDDGHFLASAPGQSVGGVTSAGKVYLFGLVRNGDEYSTVTLQTFTNPTPVEGEMFGCSIRVLGNRVLIGGRPNGFESDNACTAHLFEIDTALFNLQTPPDPPVPGVHLGSFMAFNTDSRFGSALAERDGSLVVGVPDLDSNYIKDSGGVYVVSPETGWSELTILRNPNDAEPVAGDRLGHCVAVAGGNILASAPGREVDQKTGAGVVYLFDGDGNLLQTFENPNPDPNDQFGMSMAVFGNHLVVGAPYDDEAGVEDAGAAYVFDLTTGSLLASLMNPWPDADDWFGWSVCGADGDIVIGAPGNNGGMWSRGRRWGSLSLPNRL